MTEPIQLKADTEVCGRCVSPLGLANDSIVSPLCGLLNVLPGWGHYHVVAVVHRLVNLVLAGLLSSSCFFAFLAHSVHIDPGRADNVGSVEKTVFSGSDIHSGRPNARHNLGESSEADTSWQSHCTSALEIVFLEYALLQQGDMLLRALSVASALFLPLHRFPARGDAGHLHMEVSSIPSAA
jgi:hypothetical protein